jgi:hypothetical protein
LEHQESAGYFVPNVNNWWLFLLWLLSLFGFIICFKLGAHGAAG